MSLTQQRPIPPTERDDQPQASRLQHLLRGLVPHGNDNLQRADTVDDLVQSKRSTWEVFVRWLMLGGLLFVLLLVAVLAFVYSGYP